MSQGAAGNPTVAMIEAAFRASRTALALREHGGRAGGPRRRRCAARRRWAFADSIAACRTRSRSSRISTGWANRPRLMGAVNCVVRRDDQLIGENTDGKGFLNSLQRSSIRGQEAWCSSARAAPRAPSRWNSPSPGHAAITVVNRSEARGEELAELLRTQAGSMPNYVPWRGDYAVPAGPTSSSTPPPSAFTNPRRGSQIVLDSLAPGMVVADVVFNPPRTRFLRDADARGCTVARRPRHAREPRRDRHPILDRHRPRCRGDAPSARAGVDVA